ncbi:MAG TPA: ABC transporter substrate-binding protein, partial [Clostridium sp.]|nr:ABC transporter substrate-binding protein [Clostridium sp.]
SENASGKEIQMTFSTYLAGENVGAVFFLPEVERFNQKYAGKYKIVIEEVPQAQYAEKIKQWAQQNKLPAIVHAPGSGGIDLQWFKSVVLANGMAYDLDEFANANPEGKKKKDFLYFS